LEGSEIYVKDLCIKSRIIEVEMLDIINTLLGRPLSAGKSFREPLQLNVAHTPCVLGGELSAAIRTN